MDPIRALHDLLEAILSNDRQCAEGLALRLHVWLRSRSAETQTAEPASGYQGWKNYETWAVHLWLSGECETDRHCCLLARKAIATAATCGQVQEGTWRIEEAPRLLLAEDLKELLDCQSPLRDEASVYSDLLGSAMYEVDWDEIAEAFLAAVQAA